jgi:hypothetical protein
LRLDDEAQAIFDEWRMKLEGRLKSAELHPAFESHLAKYRKLVPSLALICALADGGTRAIDGASVLRALANAEVSKAMREGAMRPEARPKRLARRRYCRASARATSRTASHVVTFTDRVGRICRNRIKSSLASTCWSIMTGWLPNRSQPGF